MQALVKKIRLFCLQPEYNGKPLKGSTLEMTGGDGGMQMEGEVGGESMRCTCQFNVEGRRVKTVQVVSLSIG